MKNCRSCNFDDFSNFFRSEAEFRDSLTELENFIDSYAAEEETDDDEGKSFFQQDF